MTQLAMLIDGKARLGSTTFDVINPATGAPFATCPKADLAMLDEAVNAANEAFPAWAALPIEDRAAALVRIADAIDARIEEFTSLLTSEQGKPLDQARREIMMSSGSLRVYATMRPESRVMREDGNSRILEIRKPLGVVAAITPWNFPMILLMGKVGPALIVGNTMVIKPAPTTPLTSLLFGEICRQELPAGVVNILCDENELGAALTAHPGVAKISFTGSTATGSKVMASAAGTIKRVTLELGGNDAALLLDDVDPVETARRIYPLAMINAGQVCMAIKRVYVPEALYDDFCAEIAKLASGAVVGAGDTDGVQIGPVQNANQFKKLKELLDEAHRKGKVIAGGQALNRAGYFIQPTIVRDIPEESRLVSEEQFGPILPVMAYSNLDEAIERINDSEFGLGGSVWSKDAERGAEVAARMESGTVWVNQHIVTDQAIPFRGAKQSGLGGEMGQEGLHEYCQAHIINIASASAPTARH